MRILSNACVPNYLLSANPGVILDAQYHDFDEQAERLVGFDQSYLQLTPGPFVGRFLSCFLSDKVSIHLEHCTQALEQSVTGPSDAVTVGVLANADEPFCLNGGSFTSGNVMIAMPGSTFHLHSPIEGAVIAIIVQKDHLQGHSGLSALANDWLFAPEFGAQLLNAPQLARRIREDVVQAIQGASFVETGKASAAYIGDALLAGLVSKLSLEISGHGTTLSGTIGSASYEKFLKGRNAIHKNWDTIHGVDDLLAETGGGRRALQNSFASHVALGPLSYHRLLRLHMARRALGDPSQFRASIGDIAARHGFWGWSQFTKLYQSHFGQLPSETRAEAGLLN
ncbi:helix-turn-helix domain-containing protein [uncultured Ruegeria sp.]|uniref:helix-turn-helix domain-containing protein n=1 Tax=uncultured Ruegeria sp. TaxID=259304 RepID=UPI00260EC291|nr:helix-turn-helix domain-containing protein [uncultured Ruegeria sp.]